jgi:hypothetical protein
MIIKTVGNIFSLCIFFSFVAPDAQRAFHSQKTIYRGLRVQNLRTTVDQVRSRVLTI